MSDELLDLATDHLTSLIPAVGRMGLRVVDVAPGRAATEVPFEGNGNHVGTMYAGVLYSVAEVLGVEEADLLMDRPPGGWGDLVTNASIAPRSSRR